MNRRVLAMQFAPAVPAITEALFNGLLSSPGSKGVVFGLSLMFALPVSYLASCVFGYPYLLFLQRHRLFTTPIVLLGSVVFGALTLYLFSFLFAAFLGSGAPLVPPFSLLTDGAVLGLSAALAYCLIAGVPWFKRPKED